MDGLSRCVYLTYCFCHFLRPFYFIFFFLEVSGEYIPQDFCDSRNRDAFGRSCGPSIEAIRIFSDICLI